MKRAILNEQYLNGYIINENAPIGTIQIFGGEHIPNGYLQAMSEYHSGSCTHVIFEYTKITD